MTETKKQYIDHYQIMHSLGKGGMGEVFLAHDPLCMRYVALKQILPGLARHKTIQERFLREARIAAQLAHPSIIPIYNIFPKNEGSYYTMPYVEGQTLKQILSTTRDQEKKGTPLHHIGGSIPSLIRIFLSVCQAIAYTHSKRILHRDLKPENIIVGKYGEVLILDWGLAEMIDQPYEEKEEIPASLSTDLTRPGKTVGTLAYMAPERAAGESANFLTDIYSLGVILYQLLTLHLPFQRPSLEHFTKHHKNERLIDPTEQAPYRDIPRQLADITRRCLHPEKDQRYQRMEDLIADLENYIEGRPEWIFAAKLKIDDKNDWAFQENLLLAKHIAITRATDIMEWVSLMISKESFPGNIRLEAKVRLGNQSHGIGFLLNISESSIQKGLDGFCLWIGSDDSPGCKLFRSSVEVAHQEDVFLEGNTYQKVRIEKIDNSISLFLNEKEIFSYSSHIPLPGEQVGLLYRDADFQIEELNIFAGSQNAMVGCLSIPDAFLAQRDFAKALTEYRRIGHSFPGRAEGREALFRAGITLLEEALSQKSKFKKQSLLLMALEEFGKLHGTPGAPLEYLGKSLVYKAENDLEEEIKCLELALRKFPKHPLIPILMEHIIFRLHETSLTNRTAAYQFALLSLRHLPQIFSNTDNQKLLISLTKHWENLYFIQTPASFVSPQDSNIHLSVQLAFWLAKPITLVEIIENTQPTDDSKRTIIENALYSLLKLGCWQWVQELLAQFREKQVNFPLVQIALSCHESIEDAIGQLEALSLKKLSSWETRALLHLFERAFDTKKVEAIIDSDLFSCPVEEEFAPLVDSYRTWALLLSGKWKDAEEIFNNYPQKILNQESHPLFIPYGCYLWKKEGKKGAMNHFATDTDVSYPPSASLLSQYLMNKIDLKKGWITQAFFWEKMQLWRQLILFSHCSRQTQKAALFEKHLKKELSSIQATYCS